MVKKWEPLTLDDYLGAEPIGVVNREVNYLMSGLPSRQIELFEGDIKLKNNTDFYKKVVSRFYEALTHAIVGGDWRGMKNSSTIDWVFYPDVVTKDEIFDSKGVCWQEKCPLWDLQIDRYLLQQCENVFMPPKKISYYIFKYKVDHPTKCFDKFKNETVVDDIISTLSSETGYLLALPFRVIHNLHNPEIHSKYKSRYDGERWVRETRFLSRGMKQMLISPEEVLSSINLNSSNFNIIKTNLPEGIKINGNEVASFPILRIEDKNGNYESWLQQLKEENAEKLSYLKEEKHTKDIELLRQEGCSDIELFDESAPSKDETFTDEVPF
jgi:hypothetical protein